MAAGPDVAAGWRLFSVAGAVSCVVSLRIVLGPAVVVRPEGLRVQPSWPFRRDIAWYRILDVEVVPVLWVLDIELNNGQHVQLPAVERLNELYDLVEAHRHDLDG
jgi:(2Fe-2S) ferredoxin